MTAADVRDAALVAASGSDPEAFGSLFDRHVDTIYVYICRRVCTSLAEELSLEGFRRARATRGERALSSEDQSL